MELYTDDPGFLFFTRRFNLSWEPQGREAVFGLSYGPTDDEWLDLTCVVPDPRGDHRGRTVGSQETTTPARSMHGGT